MGGEEGGEEERRKGIGTCTLYSTCVIDPNSCSKHNLFDQQST